MPWGRTAVNSQGMRSVRDPTNFALDSEQCWQAESDLQAENENLSIHDGYALLGQLVLCKFVN